MSDEDREEMVISQKQRLLCGLIEKEIKRLRAEIEKDEAQLKRGECGMMGNVVIEGIWSMEDDIEYLKDIRMEIIGERVKFSGKTPKSLAKQRV